jgi:hypothetical protein
MPFDGRDYISFQPVRKVLYLVGQVMSGSLWGQNLRNAYAYSRRHAQGMECFAWPRPAQLINYFDDPDTIVGAAGTPQRIYPWRRYVAAHWTHVVVHFVFTLAADVETEVELQLTGGTDASPALDTATITVPVGSGIAQIDPVALADPFLDTTGTRYEAIIELPLVNAVGPGRRFFQLFARSVPIGTLVGSFYLALRPDAVSAWLESRG